MDYNNLYTNQRCFIIPREDYYLLGILNSKLFFFLFKNKLPKLRGGYYEPSYVFLKNFPIKTIDKKNHTEKQQHDLIVTLVKKMLKLHKQLSDTIMMNDKEKLQIQINKTDQKIDELVYQLYDLTDEEMKIIEESTNEK